MRRGELSYTMIYIQQEHRDTYNEFRQLEQLEAVYLVFR